MCSNVPDLDIPHQIQINGGKERAVLKIRLSGPPAFDQSFYYIPCTLQDIGGAHLVNISKSDDDLALHKTESFTMCFRFYLRVLGTIEFQKRGNVIHIPGLLQLWATYPNRTVIRTIFSFPRNNIAFFNNTPVCSSLDPPATS